MARPDTATPTRSQEGNAWSSQDEIRPDTVRQRPLATTGVDTPRESPASTPQADGDTRATNQPTGNEGNEGTENEQDRRSRIELQAYHLYLERGGAPGGELDDWLAAERHVDARTD